MPDTHTARITNTEQDIVRLRKDMREDVIALHKKIDERTSEIMGAIQELRTHQAVDDAVSTNSLDAIKAGLCPDPGACMRLAPRVAALELQFSKWHDMQQQAKGAIKTVRAFWLGVGALGTTVFWLIQNYLTSK